MVAKVMKSVEQRTKSPVKLIIAINVLKIPKLETVKMDYSTEMSYESDIIKKEKCTGATDKEN